MRVNPDGPCPNLLAIFGEAPGYEEQMEGRGFVGKSGRELWAGVKRFCELERKDFYVSNVVKEALPKNRDPKPSEIAEAMPEFIDEILAVRPSVVVTAGAFATRAVLGPVPMSDVHGVPHRAEIAGHQFVCHPIYHPAAGLHNKGFLAAFAWDLGSLNALLRGKARPHALSGIPVRSQWFSGGPDKVFGASTVAVDTEGWADNPKMLSFTVNGTDAWVIRADDALTLRRFGKWIQPRRVVMHNGIHDVPVLRAMGIEIGTFDDTQVLAYHNIIRTGSGVLEAESQNLGTLAYRECGMRLGELADIPGVDFDEQIIPDSDQVRQYAGEDACATWRLFHVYKTRGLVDYAPYQIDMGQVPLIEQMVRTGIPFDTDATLDYYTDVLGKLDVVTEELRAKAARLGNRDFNPGSHPQVRDLLTRKIGLRIRKRTKGGQASTNEKALADFRGEPFVEKIQEFRELQKLRGTYLAPLLEELSV